MYLIFFAIFYCHSNVFIDFQFSNYNYVVKKYKLNSNKKINLANFYDFEHFVYGANILYYKNIGLGFNIQHNFKRASYYSFKHIVFSCGYIVKNGIFIKFGFVIKTFKIFNIFINLLYNNKLILIAGITKDDVYLGRSFVLE